MSYKDLSGEKFGHWTVLYKDAPHSGARNSYYVCKCDCGNIKVLTRSSLVSGRSKSCGCVKERKLGINSTHGMSKTRIYHEWTSMRRRCRSTKGASAKDYALKGIKVCEEWDSNFIAFRDWAYSNGYSDELTIDRIDNSKGYSPENCRWVSFSDQARNKTNNVIVEYNGEQWCLRTLCCKIGFPYKLAHRRYTNSIKKGEIISTDKLFAPVDEKKIAKRYRHS